MIGFYAAGAMGQGAGPALWTPANLPTLPKIWADWNSAVTAVSGSASAWSNSNGSIGGSFDQSSSGARPAIKTTGLNSKRYLEFDGVDDFMRMTSAGAGGLFRDTGAGWAFTVLRKRGTDSSAIRGAIYAGVATGNGPSRFNSGVGLASPNQNSAYFSTRRLDGDSTATLAGPATPAGWGLRLDAMDWSTGAAEIYYNGELHASNSSLTSSGNTSDTDSYNSNITVAAAAGTAVPGGYGDIDVACVLMGNGAVPSQIDRERLEGWAAWQCGLQDNLPIGHPYRSAPPYV